MKLRITIQDVQAASVLFVLMMATACGPSRSIVRVIHTTDVHGYFGGRANAQSPATGVPAASGLRGLARTLDALNASGTPYLLLDSGDAWSGTLLSDPSEGALGVRLFNLLNYDAAALGNHEFDYGPIGPPREGSHPFGALKARLAESTFPWLAANLLDRATGRLPSWEGLASTTVLRRAGHRVGVIGIITPETPSITFPHVDRVLRFDAAAAVIEREAMQLRREGVDAVLVLAHEGGKCTAFDDPDDLSTCTTDSPIFTLARSLRPGAVDAIFGGHTHASVAHRVNGIALLQPGCCAEHMAVLDLIFEEGAPASSIIHPPQPLVGRGEGPLSLALDAVLSVEEQIVHDQREESLGAVAAQPLTTDYHAGSVLGAVLCDVLQAAFPDRQICILNSGGIRREINEGVITYGELYDALPFGNAVAFVELTGAQLTEMVIRGTSGAHGVLQVGGLKVVYDRGADPCPTVDRDGDGRVGRGDRNRLVSVLLADATPLEPEAR